MTASWGPDPCGFSLPSKWTSYVLNADCCRLNVTWRNRALPHAATLLETLRGILLCRMPDCSCLQMSTFVKAVVELRQTEGLEGALFTCSEECCPARTLLYLSGTQGHSAGRVPPQSFHLTISTTKHNVGEGKWNSCSCCNSVQKLWFNGPFITFDKSAWRLAFIVFFLLWF